MTQELANTQNNALEAFLQSQALEQGTVRSNFLTPMKIEFNGQIGKYFKRFYDETKKEYVKEEFLQEWHGTILNPIMHYYKWKYDPNNTRFSVRTREFKNFKDSIEVIRVDYQAEDKDKRVTSLGYFLGSDDLKAKFGHTDFATGVTKYPWDLVVSLYIYIHELDIVVNYQFDSSTTRQEFWDYQKPNNYASINGSINNDIKTFVQVKTKFSSKEVLSETLKNDDGTPKRYFSGLFQTSGLNSIEELTKIMEIKKELDAWMDSFKPVRAIEVQEHTAALPEGNLPEIDVSKIPF